MKITVESQEMKYMYDSSIHDKTEGGFIEQYHPTIEEAVNAAMDLLGCVYGHDKVEEYLDSRSE